MSTYDPYQAPQSAPPAEFVPYAGGDELASPWIRLGAALLDSLIGLLVMGPLMWVGGFYSAVIAAARAGDSAPLGLIFGWSAVSFIAFVLIQGYPLYKSGQTWGKKAVGIRIVDMDGDVPPLGQLLLMRYVIGQVASQVPYVGRIYSLVDALFIFRQDRRCIHDLIAGTRVVVAR